MGNHRLPAPHGSSMPRLVALLFLLVWPALASAQTVGDPRKVLTRIAFGSCANQEMPQPIWQAVLGYRPELFLFTGDNVYGDYLDGKAVTDESRIPESLATAYARAGTHPEFQSLVKSVPHLATWDDNDYGRNDGGVEFVHKGASQKLFTDFWKLPADDPRRSRPGVYHAVTFGPAGKRVQLILLDTRFFRSPLKITDQRGAPARSATCRMIHRKKPCSATCNGRGWRNN